MKKLLALYCLYFIIAITHHVMPSQLSSSAQSLSDIKDIKNDLFLQVIYGDTDAVEKLAQSIHPNNLTGSRLLLHAAVRHQQDSMITKLIKLGANVNLTDGNNNTALHVAVIRHNSLGGYFKVIQALIDSGDCLTNIENNDAKTAYALSRESNDQNLRDLFDRQ